MLTIDELSVNYGGLTALDSASFAVGTNEIVGLIGPNGAGKTTCIDAITGFATVSHGRVALGDDDLTTRAPHQRAQRGLIRTFQSVELFDDLTVEENLAVACTPHNWWSPLVDMIRPRNASAPIAWALDAVGLTDRAASLPTDLSHGQRRLIGVARALVAKPRVVLLDEPAAGLDPGETEALAEVIRRIPDLGTSVLLVDHDMSLVLAVCARIIVLDFGQVIATGNPDEIRGNPLVIAAYLGSSAES